MSQTTLQNSGGLFDRWTINMKLKINRRSSPALHCDWLHFPRNWLTVTCKTRSIKNVRVSSKKHTKKKAAFVGFCGPKYKLCKQEVSAAIYVLFFWQTVGKVQFWDERVTFVMLAIFIFKFFITTRVNENVILANCIINQSFSSHLVIKL